MDLTPQQVEALPADQKAQVIALQNQVVSSPSDLAMLLCCSGQAVQDSPFCHVCAESKSKHAGVMRSTLQYGLSFLPCSFTSQVGSSLQVCMKRGHCAPLWMFCNGLLNSCRFWLTFYSAYADCQCSMF